MAYNGYNRNNWQPRKRSVWRRIKDMIALGGAVFCILTMVFLPLIIFATVAYVAFHFLAKVW